MGTNLKKTLMWIHLSISVIASLFLVDLFYTELTLKTEKDQLDILHYRSGNILFDVDIRRGYLSYEIQKIQRNMYINGMLVFTTIILYLYMRMLYQGYEKTGVYVKRSTSILINKEDLHQSTERTSKKQK
jgi:hypothetical protein